VPHATDPKLVERIVAVRKRFRGWGPKKIEVYLEREHLDVSWPARSTIASILSRHGLIEERHPRRRTPQSTFPLAAATEPNVVWCTDFKGKFRVDRHYCHPLRSSSGSCPSVSNQGIPSRTGGMSACTARSTNMT
jgi:hypothetical protein